MDWSLSHSKNISLLYSCGNCSFKIQPMTMCAVPTELQLLCRRFSREGPLETVLLSTSIFSLKGKAYHRFCAGRKVPAGIAVLVWVPDARQTPPRHYGAKSGSCPLAAGTICLWVRVDLGFLHIHVNTQRRCLFPGCVNSLILCLNAEHRRL